ncbi:unnamed protein product [Phyllotreta striolata]|uniref:Sphingomyelin synthase-like domain-containing protein n=1 Tax=Phyllotreta striolata TaxID=444603 RepID=A0A9N9TLU7_PHYSR|nr:unnamed protein product [Phyllotreta striolata]
MSADINKITHINAFKPPCQRDCTEEKCPKSILKENQCLINQAASHTKIFTSKNITIYVEEDRLDEDDFIIVERKLNKDCCRSALKDPASFESVLAKGRIRSQKDHVVTFNCEAESARKSSPTSSDSPSDDSDEPSGDAPSSTGCAHPSEIWKTTLAALILCLTLFLNLIALSMVHDKVPSRSDGPLPDIVLSTVLVFKPGLFISEYIIMFMIFTSLTSILLFHRYSSIIFRRIFLMMSVLYLYRTITMSATILPTASKKYMCAPKLAHPNINQILRRSISLIPNFGLSVIGPQEFCGDLIYSGHTVLLVLLALLMSEYTSKNLWIVHWLYRSLAFAGILMLELAHAHYFIDVIIAYYMTTRVFWTYHTIANNEELKTAGETNFYSRAWWFQIFVFFEKNIHGPVPNEFQFLFNGDEDDVGANFAKYDSI